MELRAICIGNIKRYRKLSGLSQMALAEKCGTSTSYIGEIEIGKKFPSVDMIQKIAVALGIAPYRLFMEENDSCPAAIPPVIRKELIEKLQRSVADIIERTGKEENWQGLLGPPLPPEGCS